MKGNMKQFRIDVSHASPGQILTIAAELKIMSNSWERFGPKIMINGQKLQAPSLREPRHKRQASSSKRHNMARFI
jgi:phenylacetate-coenzyme A ligase PaaK-like adenylate-forming protein